jgi:peptide methionine sulfoxide reductase MsrB
MLKPTTCKLESGTWQAELGAIVAYGSTEAKARKSCEAMAMSALAAAQQMPEYALSADGTSLFVTHAGYASDSGEPAFAYEIVDVATGRRRCSTGMAGDFRTVAAAAAKHASEYVR